jgi:AraC-like DNA-binding protein
MSLGTFSRTFRDIVGCSPSAYRDGTEADGAPTCFGMAWTRPSSFGEANGRARI